MAARDFLAPPLLRGLRVVALEPLLGATLDPVMAPLGEHQIEAQIIEVKAELKAQGARIDDLQKVVWRVIWPLIVLLAVPVFGLLYRVLTNPPG